MPFLTGRGELAIYSGAEQLWSYLWCFAARTGRVHDRVLHQACSKFALTRRERKLERVRLRARAKTANADT